MRSLTGIVIAAAILMTISIVFFFQYKDPMLLIFGIVLSGMIAGVAALIHIMRRGTPVRVVDDEKRER